MAYGTYVAVRITEDSLLKLQTWASLNGIELDPDIHITVLYSRTEVLPDEQSEPVIVHPIELTKFGDYLVLLVSADELYWRHKALIAKGGTHDFEDYTPHITIQANSNLNPEDLSPIGFSMEFDNEYFEDLIDL